jgi:hypothetical protein
MKSSPQTPEMMRFNEALRDVMKVSKNDLKTLLRDHKAIQAVRQKRGARAKTSALDHASREKD